MKNFIFYKKFFSIILSLSLVISSIPIYAYAEKSFLAPPGIMVTEKAIIKTHYNLDELFAMIEAEEDSEKISGYAGDIPSILFENSDIKTNRRQLEILLKKLISVEAGALERDISHAIGSVLVNNKRLFKVLLDDMLSLHDDSIELEKTAYATFLSATLLEYSKRTPKHRPLNMKSDIFNAIVDKFNLQSNAAILSWFAGLINQLMACNPHLSLTEHQFNTFIDKFSIEKDEMTSERFIPLFATATQRNKKLFASFKNNLDTFVLPDKVHRVDIAHEDEYTDEFEELFKLLNDRDEMKKMIFFMSILRNRYSDNISDDSPLTPLEFAEKNNLIFKYNEFMSICPVTESFRRHVLIVKGKSGKMHYLEVKIPGQWSRRHIIWPTHYTLARKAHRKGIAVSKPVTMASTHGIFRFYNRIQTYKSSEEPMRIVIFKYEDGKRLARNVNGRLILPRNGYLERVSKNTGIPLDTLYKNITDQLRTIGRQLLDLNYIGKRKIDHTVLNDFHLENFRLLPDGTVISVCDFGAFDRKKLTGLQKKRQVNGLVKPWVEKYEVNWSRLKRYIKKIKNEIDSLKADFLVLEAQRIVDNNGFNLTPDQIETIKERIAYSTPDDSKIKRDNEINTRLVKHLIELIEAGLCEKTQNRKLHIQVKQWIDETRSQWFNDKKSKSTKRNKKIQDEKKPDKQNQAKWKKGQPMPYIIKTDRDDDKLFALPVPVSYFEPPITMTMYEIIDYMDSNPGDRFMYNYFVKSCVKELADSHMEYIIKKFLNKPSTLWFSIFGVAMGCGNKRAASFIKDFITINNRDTFQLSDDLYNSIIMELLDINPSKLLQINKILSKNRIEHKSLSKDEIALVQEYARSEGLKVKKKQWVHVRNIIPSLSIQKKSINTGMGLRELTIEQTLARIGQLSMQTVGFKDFRNEFFDNKPLWNCTVACELNLASSVGVNSYTIIGEVLFHGKGMSRLGAALSAVYEMIERISASMGFGNNWPEQYKEPMELIKARYSELLKRKDSLVYNLNKPDLNYQYKDEELYWVKGEIVTEKGYRSIYIPAQFVFLKANFNEREIDPCSTNGLGAGNTVAEAKHHALLEIIERDSQRNIVFYTPERCFTIETEDSDIQSMLEPLQKRGIHIQFLDATTEFGVPVYKAFIKVKDQVIMGCGAELDGKIAVRRALGELLPNIEAYEYKKGIIKPKDLDTSAKVTRQFERLTNYSSGNVKTDVDILEKLLLANKYNPIYVNLTHKDIQIPVIRIIVPKLEISEVFTARKYKHFKNTFCKNGKNMKKLRVNTSVIDIKKAH